MWMFEKRTYQQMKSSSDGAQSTRRFLFSYILCILFSQNVLAAPHPRYQGKFTAPDPSNPKINIHRKAMQLLQIGEPYQVFRRTSHLTGQAFVVLDIGAPSAVVWDRLLRFDKYVGMVPHVLESHLLDRVDHEEGRKDVSVRMRIGFSNQSLVLHVLHHYRPSLGSLCWNLNYSETSQLDDSVGCWYVQPHPDDPSHQSRVIYRAQVALSVETPELLREQILSKEAMSEATEWIRRQSESFYQRQWEFSKREWVRKSVEHHMQMQNTRQQREAGAWWRKLFPHICLQRNIQPVSGTNVMVETGEPTSTDTDSFSSYIENYWRVGLSGHHSSSFVVSFLPDIEWNRYFLVLTCVTLFLYNVHLYFSR